MIICQRCQLASAPPSAHLRQIKTYKIRRVKWHSQYGVIDMMAFANFQHEFKKTVMRIEAGEVVKIEPIHMKDIVISAVPDRSFQLELFSKFGQTGSILVADLTIANVGDCL